MLTVNTYSSLPLLFGPGGSSPPSCKAKSAENQFRAALGVNLSLYAGRVLKMMQICVGLCTNTCCGSKLSFQ